MALLRGTAQGLHISVGNTPIDVALADLAATFSAQPDFYRGSAAYLVLRDPLPDVEALERFLELFTEAGVGLLGLLGDTAVERLADEAGLPYGGTPALSEESRESRPSRDPRVHERPVLSDSARSLDADFAGARADLAARRASPSASSAEPDVLYHRGTVRSGQILRRRGHLVVVGDINPGAELIATGDIVVFGVLRGQAHAGAQGDQSATVTALELAPTQLRIATLIATGEYQGRRARHSGYGEVARIEEDHIIVVPLAKEIL